MTNHRQLCSVLAAALLTFLFVLSALAQSQDANTLRVTTRLVNVNVVVTDPQGKPVKGLTQDDFTILDENQPQRIEFFSVIDNVGPRSRGSPARPDTYTNHSADYGVPPSWTILLFDTLNSRWTSQGYVLHHVRMFLRQIEPQDHLGIYVLGDDLSVVHEFTRDASDLVAGLRRYDDLRSQSHETRKAAKESTGDPGLDQFLSGKDNRYRFKGVTPAYNLDKNTIAKEVTVASLESIARQLANVPGRKTLIWVTDSIGPMGYFERDDLDEWLQLWSAQGGVTLAGFPAKGKGADVERLIRLMNRVGIALYAVDSRGLETASLGFGGSSAGAGVSSSPEINTDLLEIAARTGGRAFFNRNDLETGIRRAQDDARFTYNFAYAPDHGRWKGEWRKIQIQVNRPGVTVLARGGYFALPDPQLVPPKNLFEFYSQIAASPIESTQLPLSIHIGTSRRPQSAQLDAQVHIDPLPMLLHQADGHWTGGFEVMFMQIGAKNKLLDATKKGIDANLTQQEYDKVSKDGWNLPAQLKFMPGAELLCVILHDKSTDAVGSVRIPLQHYSANLSVASPVR